jgi:hypothetical protein
MSFPICPACQQSVLDDDPVTCPFCGASMKATPGGAKPGSPKTATSAPRTPPRPAVPFPPSSNRSSMDDVSFDLGDALAPQAIAVSKTRTKSRTFQVKCPMCETVGYISPDDAGKSVKCANPGCFVPVFTAPRPEVEKPPEPKPAAKRKSNIVGVAAVTVAVMLVGGGIAWWVAGRPHETKLAGPSAEDLELVKQEAHPLPTPPVVAKKSPDKTETEPVPQQPVAEPEPTTATKESYAAILKILNDSSLEPRQNRSKPFCRRLTAEAFALAGDLPGAKDQLAALEKVGREVPFYRVMPWVQIAWQQLAKGQRKGAAKSAQEALSSAEKLPKTGRDRLETAIALAAVLIATNHESDAATLLETHRDTSNLAQLAQARQTVEALGTFDLADLEARQPALPWKSPLNVGVAYELVGHGESDAAQRWSLSLKHDRDRAEALGVWAEAVVWRAHLCSEEAPVDELRTALEALAAPGNVLALSRLGLSLALAGRDDAAADCLTKAAELAAAWEPAVDVDLPADLKQLSRFKAPDFVGGTFHVAAAGELAHLAAQIGKREQAGEFLSAALARCRALAPSPLSVQTRIQQDVKSSGIAALRERLKQEWRLKTDNEALVAATALQKTLDELSEAAQRRVEVQRQLLAQAIAWGLADHVWTYIRRGSTREDAAQADNLILTDLPSLLVEKYRTDGNQDRYDLVTGAWKQLSPDHPLTRPLSVLLDEALQQGRPQGDQQAAQLIQQMKGDPAQQDGLALRAVCRLAADGRYETALKFSSRLADPVLKEECYLLIGGMAGLHGASAVIERHLNELTQASEKVALGRGLIAGWVAEKRSRT